MVEYAVRDDSDVHPAAAALRSAAGYQETAEGGGRRGPRIGPTQLEEARVFDPDGLAQRLAAHQDGFRAVGAAARRMPTEDFEAYRTAFASRDDAAK